MRHGGHSMSYLGVVGGLLQPLEDALRGLLQSQDRLVLVSDGKQGVMFAFISSDEAM